jgi:hypothetical protein
MARKRHASNYTGALAQPIYSEDHYKFTGGLGQPIREPDAAAGIKEGVEKILLLFKHYKIDPSDEQRWQKLAVSLALAHVPGLQVANRPKAGRPSTWKTGLGDELVRAVEDVKSQTGKRTQDAIRKLRKDNPGTWGDYPVASLGARYRETRARQKQRLRLQKEWEKELEKISIKLGPGPLQDDDRVVRQRSTLPSSHAASVQPGTMKKSRTKT